MSQRTIYMIVMTIGSMIGGYLPTLLGADTFSMSSLFGSAIGGLAGIWLVYKLIN